MPSLNRQAVLERKGDQRQSHDNSHLLVDRSYVYRHGAPP